MLCQNCHKNVANVHLTHILNGKKVEMYLCDKCAKEKGQFGFNSQLNFFNYLLGIPGIGGDDYVQAAQPEALRCKVCGMSFEDFKRTGKIGCANCYKVFRENLGPILRRLHGSAEHTGKAPRMADGAMMPGGTLEKLREELAEAISREEYEKAAVLRDKIKDIEKPGTGKGVSE